MSDLFTKGTLAEKLARNTGNLLFGDREAAIRGINSRVLPLYYPLVMRRRLRAMTFEAPVFLDCGANLGQGFGVFKQIYDPLRFDYHFFEPNPHCLARLKAEIAKTRFAKAPTIRPFAVWTRAETLNFYGVDAAQDAFTQGGTLKPDQGAAGAGAPFQVQAIDFLAYLVDLQKDHDYLAMKLDIEGAELEVLERLWAHGDQLTRPMDMFVEFHALYQAPEQRRLNKARELRLKATAPAGVTLHTWY
jgi:FkbM family methyltransferase